MRILIVDDDAMILRVLARIIGRKMLNDNNIKFVETAGGVWDAFLAAKSAKEPFDIVITDVDMKDGSGFDLAELVAGIHPMPRIVFMTAVLLQWKIDAAKKYDAPVYEKTGLAAMIEDLIKPLARAAGDR